MPNFRMERLGQTIQEKISSFILEGKIKDNRVTSFLSITKVNVSKDLSYADVYVSDIRGHINEKEVEGLQSAAGFIQSQLGQTMHIRKIPKLRFHGDTSIGDGFDLIKKIESLSETENKKD
ncbi:MAG: 30S ribosome-binding factor RbfA [Treponema sp.]|nr:30S ribosome-binding factor RbfA [Treponema sp.]MCL2251150.1 30S ribosome-binding factor RbfA [Treponema sp.]